MKNHKAKTRTVTEYQQYEEIGEAYSSQHQKLEMLVPSNFRLICALLGVKAEVILHDFMWMLSYASIKNASPKKRYAARKFFMLCKYGRSRYSKKQLNTLFDELEAVRRIYDTTEGMERNEHELFWKCDHMYTEYWFKRWFNLNSRQDDMSVLKDH